MVARMTIKEIARLSGVGVSTVSRVLNKRPDVNEDTRGRVMEVIERYGYEPNSNAKHLKQLSTDCVAVIVRGRNNLFFSGILELLQKRIEAAGLRFLPHYIDENDDEAAAALRVYAERKVRGIIFMGGCHTDNGAMLSRLPIPCVYSTVNAADYLFDCGHENMVILSGETQGCNMAHQRYLGVLDSFKEHGKTLESSRVLVSPFSFSCAYERIKEYTGPDYTAIFAMSDTMAIGAARALMDSGKRVPEDVSVIGYDGIELAQYYHPALATMRQPQQELADRSVELLLESMDTDCAPKHIQLETELIQGASVKHIS